MQKFNFYNTHNDNTPAGIADFETLKAWAEHPPSLAKNDAKAIACHTANGKTKNVVIAHNSMTLCWCDIDAGNKALEPIKASLAKLGCVALVYSTASSMRLNRHGEVNGKRWRVVIPLKDAMNCERFVVVQGAIARFLDGDKSATGVAQILYAPNNPAVTDPRETQHYEWALINGDPLNPEALPAPLQASLDAVKKEGHKQDERHLKSAIKMLDDRYKADKSKGFTIADANQCLGTIEPLLRQFGYSRVGKKWISPNSESGTPGVSVFDGNRWFSHHGSDKDAGMGLSCDGGVCGDAFDLVCHYQYGGDQTQALTSLANQFDSMGQSERQQAYQEAKNLEGFVRVRGEPTTPTTNQEKSPATRAAHGLEHVVDTYHTPTTPTTNPLDLESSYHRLNLLQHLNDTNWLKRFVIQTAAQCDLPESTVFLNLLGIYSSVACRKWAIARHTGSTLPIGLYVATEQPSGAGKSYCQNIGQAPFRDIKKSLIADYKKQFAALSEKDKKELSEDEIREFDELKRQSPIVWSKAFITNSTPEGLEKELIATSGYFSCVASEQGLFDSLLGNLYSKGAANNNDLLLNGFDGQYMSSSRVTRESYSGSVIGGVTLFAQHGCVEKVLSASNDTGLAERFLMLAEPHNLGKRDHLKRVHVDDSLAKTYAERCRFAEDVYYRPLEKADLLTLHLTDNGYRLIKIYRNQIEGNLDDGEKFAALASLRGAACKIDMQILKIAANLHLLTRDDEYDPLIKDETTQAAIAIADEILNGSLSICIAKGLIGQKSEYMAILSMFDGTKQKDMPSERQILMSRTKVMPFKDYMGNRSDKVRSALQEMVALGILAKFAKPEDGQTCYRLIQ